MIARMARLRTRLSTPLAACAAAVVGAGALAAACATAETPAESHGDCVAAGCLTGTSSSSGGTTSMACTPNPACAVSWANDIFGGIVDGTAGCTTMACHGGGK